MFLYLLILFISLPLIELFLLLWISAHFGPVFTFALVLVTGIVGAAAARRQGWNTWRRIQEQLALGRAPASDMVDAMLILVAGALLITPGVLTDIIGFSLLVPFLRRLLKRSVAEYLKTQAVIRFQEIHGTGYRTTDDDVPYTENTVIDAEFTRQPPQDDPAERL